MRTDTALTRWERATRIPVIVLAVVFPVAYSLNILLDPRPPGVAAALLVVLVIVWVVFLVDYVVGLVLTPRGDRGRFLRRHIVELLSVIVPMFRALRLVRVLHQLPLLRGRSGDAVRAQVVATAVLYAALFVYFISLAELQAERDAAHATITTFWQAIWWASVTLSTVGYGDVVPVTALGRFYAVLLMAGGIVIIGTASATVISYINERVAALRHPAEHEPGGQPTER